MRSDPRVFAVDFASQRSVADIPPRGALAS